MLEFIWGSILALVFLCCSPSLSSVCCVRYQFYTDDSQIDMSSHTSHFIYRVAQPTSFMTLPLRYLSCCWVTQLNNTCVRLFETPWTAARQASLSITISQILPKFMFIALVMPSSHLILWCPLLLLPLIFPSIRDFSNESSIHITWPKHWSFSFSISPSSE